MSVQCSGIAPSSALIADFSSGSVFGAWGTSLFGGTYVYPGLPRTSADCGPVTSYPMTETKSNGVWNITGTVGSYSGMGLWWMCRSAAGGTDYASSCLVDASAFTGISFVVSGDAGPKGSIAVHLATPSTMRPTVDYLGNPSNCGTCTSATCGIDVPIPVTATPTTVSLTWAELGVTKPDAIAMILFVLPDPCNYSTGRCVATPYAANIILDDIKLTN